MAMETATIPPTTPPAMAPMFELLPPEPDEDPVKDGVRVEVGVREVVEVVDTPLGPKNAPGPYSGLSMSNVGETIAEGERKDRGHDTHHLLEALRKGTRCYYAGVYCEYVAIEENFET